MTIDSRRIVGSYAEPNCLITRTTGRENLGGAASTIYGRIRFFQQSIARAVHFLVNVADAASSAYTVYYSPNSDPSGASDVALGSAWTVGTGAAGTTKTIYLGNLTASGALTVDADGFPQFAPGDALYVKSGSSNGANGRVDIGVEWQFQSTAMLN